MEFTALSAIVAALGFAFKSADAFFVPAGSSVVGGPASVAARLNQQAVTRSSGSKEARAPACAAGCSCIGCKLIGGRSCGCPSCSRGVSAQSHAVGCRCGACSVRMQAHPEGCGCGDCSASASPSAFHGQSCDCPDCSACSGTNAHGMRCLCSMCANGRRRRALTVMGAKAGVQASEPEAGAALFFKDRLAEEPESVMFEDTMTAINNGFLYSPKRFVNGETRSDAGVNEGSCKVFAFGKIAKLSAEETLACFGEHYRGVLADPDGDSHGNIRAFMKSGWEGVEFPDGLSLSPI